MSSIDVNQKALAIGYDNVTEHMSYSQYRAAIVTYESAKASEQPVDMLLEHGMNCAGDIPNQQADCTCGLKWRIMLQTEREMHNAWRKRAEEAETALAKWEREVSQPVDCREAFEKWAWRNGHYTKDRYSGEFIFSDGDYKIWQAAWNARAPERESGTQALAMLHGMIDGGEECRGRDSEISDIIRILEQ